MIALAKRLCWVIGVAMLLGLAGAGALSPAWAQDPVAPATEDETRSPPDYSAWDEVAARATEAVTAGRASTVALEELRAQIVEWRARFQGMEDYNAAQIRTLKQQIAALGPPPEDGKSESPDIAQRRSELNDQLSLAQAPALRAQEAYRQADGLVREIDRVVRDRQTDALLENGPSPLNPGYWAGAWGDFSRSIGAVYNEVTRSWGKPSQQTQMRENLPVILLYLAVATLLVLRSRFWIELVVSRLQLAPRLGTAVTVFFLSLGQVALPVIGLIALTRLIYALGVVGLRGDAFLAAVPVAGLAIFGARWLGNMLLPADRPGYLLNLSGDKLREGRLVAALLGWAYAAWHLFEAMAAFEDFGPGTYAVLAFPIILVTALLIFLWGRLLLLHVHEVPAGAEEMGNRDRIVSLLGRVILLFALAGPVLAATGFTTAAVSVTFPTVLTIALIGLMWLLQQLVVDIYAVLVRGEDRARDALIPVLIGFGISLAGLPVLALIWGARVADLTELWARFREGFVMGDTRISPTDFLWFAVIFAVGYGLTRLVQSMVRTSVLPKTRIDVGGRNAIVAGLGYFGIFVAAVLAITTAGIDLSSLAIVAGALSVGIGFGLQTIVSNFVSGIILLIERPVSEGDWIEVGGVTGFVRDISVRSTRIETFDRTDIIVPNADLITGMVTNWTHGNLIGRAIVPVGVAYGTDTRRVERILREVAEAHPMVLANPAPGVLFKGFGADSMDFEIRAILRDVNYVLQVKSDMNHEIARRFAEEGVEIPFAQRDIWLRNPEALHPGPPQGQTAVQRDPAGPDGAEAAAAPGAQPPDEKDGR